MPDSAPQNLMLSLGQCAALACMWEATAPKPGNVHRGADFEDLTYADLVMSGIIIGPLLDVAEESGLGSTVLRAVHATKQAVSTNSNLGMILLFAPLAMVPRHTPIASGIGIVLATLTAQDAALVYEAIRFTNPGGLGKVKEGDVAGAPPADLIHAMHLAEERDLVARQYCCGFADVLEIAQAIEQDLACGLNLQQSLVHRHVTLMSKVPDSLIARKCGFDVAKQSADRAAFVLAAGDPLQDEYRSRLEDLDFWLRSDGHRRNPGTTADLVAAGLFAALCEGTVQPPFPSGYF